MKEVVVRFLSGLLYVTIILISLFTSREWYISTLFILAIITLNEFLRLVNLKGIWAYILLIISFYFVSYKEFNEIVILSLLAITILVNLVLFKDVLFFNKLSLFKKRRYFCILFYIITGFLFLSMIPFVGNIFEPKIVLGIFILAWTNDTFAYLVGKNFGKRKLMEKISPNKTVEGFIGGLLASVIASYFIFNYTYLHTKFIWLTLALLVSVIGTSGDLIQSKFKRLAGVKDSGKIMPGHGGVYDRLDSIIYTSPFIYLFLIVIDYVS